MRVNDDAIVLTVKEICSKLSYTIFLLLVTCLLDIYVFT